MIRINGGLIIQSRVCENFILTCIMYLIRFSEERHKRTK